MNGDAEEPRIVSVGEFSSRLKDVFRRVKPFAHIGVTGEISELRPSQYGLGFTLKDERAILKCFAFSNSAKTFPKVENGTAVVAFGSVEVQEKWGYYQLLVTALEPTGQGELHQRYLALKEQFRAQGLFDAARKKAVPEFPLHVALVSAGQGKGADDFLKTMQRGAPHVRVTFVETRVQGDGAEIDIGEAVDRAGKSGAAMIVLARGGGSYEDLFPFNLTEVVQSIVRAKVPLVTAIGHSDDHHLADDVADAFFGTPSIAAEAIVKRWEAGRNRLLRSLGHLDRESRRLQASWLQTMTFAERALDGAVPLYLGRRAQLVAQREQALTKRSPQRRVAEMQAAFGGATGRLTAGARRAIDDLRRAVERRDARLDTLSPAGPLERGYAIVSFDGKPLREASVVKAGDVVSARLWHGTIAARVESTDPT